MKRLIRGLNSIFSAMVLFLFYLFIIPWGKIIFIITKIFKKKDVESYWQTPDTRKLEISSPY